MGAARDQLRPGLRALPYRNYVIHYVPTKDELVNVRVLHGAREARAVFSA
jgi:plasmid stabilization system protein ParE